MAKTNFTHGAVVEPEFLNAINNPTYSDDPQNDGEINEPDALKNVANVKAPVNLLYYAQRGSAEDAGFNAAIVHQKLMQDGVGSLTRIFAGVSMMLDSGAVTIEKLERGVEGWIYVKGSTSTALDGISFFLDDVETAAYGSPQFTDAIPTAIAGEKNFKANSVYTKGARVRNINGVPLVSGLVVDTFGSLDDPISAAYPNVKKPVISPLETKEILKTRLLDENGVGVTPIGLQVSLKPQTTGAFEFIIYDFFSLDGNFKEVPEFSRASLENYQFMIKRDFYQKTRAFVQGQQFLVENASSNKGQFYFKYDFPIAFKHVPTYNDLNNYSFQFLVAGQGGVSSWVEFTASEYAALTTAIIEVTRESILIKFSFDGAAYLQAFKGAFDVTSTAG